jgi:hypothetical protein
MPITENDLKLLASARMTDTADGGGRLTGNVVQSGVDNNIFDDVSNLDRVYGRTSLRKVFGAVLTADTDKYLGARVILDEPPADPNVHGVIFGASSVFDNRAQATVKVESYLAPGPFYQGLLYGDHLAGMQTVLLFQQLDRSLPTIGQVLLLRKNQGLPTEVNQYVRVTALTSVVQAFTDGSGDFQRRVVTCAISDPLRAEFPGWQAQRIDANLDYTGKTRVFDTIVADAAQYFGIKPLAESATLGAFTLKTEGIYSPIIPSAQIETPIVDARSNNTLVGLQQAGASVSRSITLAFTTTQQMFVGGAILPGSLTVDRASTILTDNSGKLRNGSDVGTVDYENGILSLFTNVWGGAGGTHTVTYTPAAAPQAVSKSVGIPININNRSLSYALTLENIPARATLSVSYLTDGRWYVLREKGTGAITGEQSGLGAGTLNYTTGSVALTLGALPDVDSAVILQWGESIAASTVPPAALLEGKLFAAHDEANALVKADSPVTITWNDGSPRTATRTGMGFTGDGAGSFEQWATNVNNGVKLRFAPNTLPVAGTVFTFNYSKPTTATYSASDLTAANVGAAMSPGTVRIKATAVLAYNVAQQAGFTTRIVASSDYSVVSDGAAARTLPSHSNVIVDDGAGNLVLEMDGAKINVGTVNYTTGAVTISGATPGATWPGPRVVLSTPPVPNNQAAAGTLVLDWTSLLPGTVRAVSITIAPQAGNIEYGLASGTAQSFTFTPGEYRARPASVPAGRTLSNVRFALGSSTYVQRAQGTVLERDTSPITGLGTTAGAVNNGEVTVTSWTTNVTNSIGSWAGSLVTPTDGLNSPFVDAKVMFRTAAAPLRPGSLSVLGTLADGVTFNITAGVDGKINAARVKGRVNYETGVVELYFVQAAATAGSQEIDLSHLQIAGLTTAQSSLVRTPSLRYNAVTYTYLPLDANILGLDPVRLPSDGRVPVFKAGRVVVVHNTQRMSPATVTNGQTLNTGRIRLAKLRVIGNNGAEITTGFTRNLDAGTVTFNAVAGYSQPVTVEHRIEDEALCAEAQITGDLRLTRPLTHNFPAPGTYVSSALVIGDVQGAAGDSFSQSSWTSEWSDVRIGAPITAQYNQAGNPITTTNAGAISERWALIFTSSTTFRVIGESLGEILTSNTGVATAPINGATGVPYFTIASAGWGVGWAAGNVLRFNTRGGSWPIWVARTVLQSPAAPPGTDQMVISIRGDVNV